VVEEGERGRGLGEICEFQDLETKFLRQVQKLKWRPRFIGAASYSLSGRLSGQILKDRVGLLT
jgi:hypothetical protein